ncbi:MAG: glycosyltransferase, partial [Pseudomonadota bacterium]
MSASRAPSLPVIALVTAYNEAPTIGAILDVLQSSPSISKIQVVDDASTDGTYEVAKEKGVTVIRLAQKVPVGQAIMHHLDVIDEEAILLWCDADLLGLKVDHIERLVARYREGNVSQSLSSRGVP